MSAGEGGNDSGWEDVGHGAASGTGNVPPAFSGSSGQEGVPGGPISDAVTSAMVNHFAKEFTKGGLSMWPQFVLSAKRYFNVSHGYVARKILWQLAPMPNAKKKPVDGEIGREKDWTARIYEGLEIDIEEPDMYIPVMAFASYVMLNGLVKGLQDQFSPDVLFGCVSFAMIIVALEVAVAKAALFMAGAVNAPVFDLLALFGYMFFYLCLNLILGILLGCARNGAGFLYHFFMLALMGSSGFALFQSMRRLARMQPALGKECVQHVHDTFIKVLPGMQALAYWLLLPSWPKQALAVAEAISSSGAGEAANVAASSAAPSVVAEAVATITTTIAAAVGASGN